MDQTEIVDYRASERAILCRIKIRRKMMEQTVYNPQKGRLVTIDIEITDENTTWFDEYEYSHDIFSITDWKGGIIIIEEAYTYPLWVYDISRADIGYDCRRARELHMQYV